MEDKINLLVVDDEQIVLDSIRIILRNESYNITTVLSVNEAFAELNNNPYEIILTDLMMPDIDGLELLKKVKEINPTILVIMVTGYATINTALQAMQLGAFDYIAKPFTKEELKKLLQRAYNFIKDNNKENLRHQQTIQVGDSQILTGVQTAIGKYSWIMKDEDGTVLMGVERQFLYTIGKIQTVYLPSPGDEVRQGSVYFQIFSLDLRAQSLQSPLTGIVKEVNNYVLENPETALQDPYGSGWLIRIIPTYFEEEIKLLGR